MNSAARLDPLVESDFADIRALGERIWRQHYSSILGRGQVDYMLSGRYTASNLRDCLNGEGRWFWVLRLGPDPIGFVRYVRMSSTELKVEELYVDAAQRGHGFGAHMIHHAEAHARALGCRTLTLCVNKRNRGALAVYEKLGFRVREAVVTDIGGGYVMDDYVMEKHIAERAT